MFCVFHRTANPFWPVSLLLSFSSLFLKEPAAGGGPLHFWLLLEQWASQEAENLCWPPLHLGALNLDRRAAAGFEDALLSSLLKIAPAVPLASETSEAPTEWANLSAGEPTYILSNCFWPDRDPRHQSQKEGKSWLDLNAVRL